jgi:hypothetical protein
LGSVSIAILVLARKPAEAMPRSHVDHFNYM